jgi:hypothetical protein
MTARKASLLLTNELKRRGIAFERITSKSVSFHDLARDSAIFATIHGWKPSPVANDLKAFGKDNGFFVHFE